jgi:hypothetical protein
VVSQFGERFDREKPSSDPYDNLMSDIASQRINDYLVNADVLFGEPVD